MKIAQIYLQFNLTDIYEMMIKRGEAMREHKIFDQIKWEMKMKHHIKSERDEITIPKDAYITFENEQSYDVGYLLIGASDDQVKVDGYWVDLDVATEPSNIEY